MVFYGGTSAVGLIFYLLAVYLYHQRWDYVLGGVIVTYLIFVFLPWNARKYKRARKDPSREF